MRIARFLTVLGFSALTAGAVMASTVLGLTIEDQARLSSHVVIGTVVGQEGVDHPVNGLETAVTLEVETALKGSAATGRRVVFHTRSGELNGASSKALGEAELQTGRRYLVFIESVDGRPYNIGLSYGVFDVLEDSRGRLAFTRAIADGLEVAADAGVGNGPFTLDDLAARISYAARHPRFDHPMVREAFGGGR
jgi:hypothetical protein